MRREALSSTSALHKYYFGLCGLYTRDRITLFLCSKLLRKTRIQFYAFTLPGFINVLLNIGAMRDCVQTAVIFKVLRKRAVTTPVPIA